MDSTLAYDDALAQIGMVSPVVARRQKPTAGNKQKAKQASQQPKVTPTGKRPVAGVVVDASAKKLRTDSSNSNANTSDIGAPSRAEVGHSVIISQNAKKELRGKTATVVSVGSAWTKVNVPGTGEVSLRAKELSPSGEAAAPRVQSKITLGPSVGAYPAADPSSKGLSAAAAARALGRGSGAASAQGAADLVGAVCDFEVARVRGASSSASSGSATTAEPLVDLLEAVGQAAKRAVPHAVATARARRLASVTSGQASKLTAEVEALRKAEQAWAALEAAQEAHGGNEDPETAAVSDSGEGEGGDSDEDDNGQAGFELVLSKDADRGQQRVEAAALELELLNQKAMRTQVVARHASETESALARSNQGLHFTGDLAEVAAPGDAKGAIRGLLAKSPKR